MPPYPTWYVPIPVHSHRCEASNARSTFSSRDINITKTLVSKLNRNFTALEDMIKSYDLMLLILYPQLWKK